MKTKLDNQLLAERYDQVSEGQFKNGRYSNDLDYFEKKRTLKGIAVISIAINPSLGFVLGSCELWCKISLWFAAILHFPE